MPRLIQRPAGGELRGSISGDSISGDSISGRQSPD